VELLRPKQSKINKWDLVDRGEMIFEMLHKELFKEVKMYPEALWTKLSLTRKASL